MICPSCATENRTGAKFCGGCGAALVLGCPSCGEPYEPGQRFCNDCSASLDDDATSALSAAPPVGIREAPIAERRFVSVLFADLVGFTTLSASPRP